MKIQIGGLMYNNRFNRAVVMKEGSSFPKTSSNTVSHIKPAPL